MYSDYLIVDGHSVIFAWPELRRLHERRTSLAREALIKKLRDYQDWTGVRAVVVFDGKGRKVSQTSNRAKSRFFIRAQAKRPILSSNDWLPSTRRNFASQWRQATMPKR